MPRLAVLGYPISHSRSPVMHTAALAELGLAAEWTYEAIEVAPENFTDVVDSLPGDGFAGVNVTLPHKVAALAVAERASSAATAIGAANTLSFADGTTAAGNTDAAGIVAALPGPPAGARALVMGAGGSARAAIWALREAGAEVSVWNRTAVKAQSLSQEFGVTHAEAPATASFDVIVNATTVGMKTASGGQPLGERGNDDLKRLPIDADGLNVSQTVVDLVYGPQETALITAARARRATAIDGLEVLVRQGAASLELWTGRPAPLEVMRRAARGE